MIDGKYRLKLLCANAGRGCALPPLPMSGKFVRIFAGINAREAHGKARHAGWLFKADDVLCPKCAEPYQRKPRYPGGRRL